MKLSRNLMGVRKCHNPLAPGSNRRSYILIPAALGMYELLLPSDLKGLKTIWNILLKFASHSQKASIVFWFKNQYNKLCKQK